MRLAILSMPRVNAHFDYIPNEVPVGDLAAHMNTINHKMENSRFHYFLP
jgi:hypothetical protein